MSNLSPGSSVMLVPQEPVDQIAADHAGEVFEVVREAQAVNGAQHYIQVKDINGRIWMFRSRDLQRMGDGE